MPLMSATWCNVGFGAVCPDEDPDSHAGTPWFGVFSCPEVRDEQTLPKGSPMIALLWHVWRKGHSVEVNRGMTRAMADTSKGWLYRCECGKTVAR